MKRTWLGLAFLAGSWMFGLRYYHAPNWWVWTLLVAGGSALFLRAEPAPVTRAAAWAAAALSLFPGAFLPWPYRAAPLLLGGGMLLRALPFPRRWPGRLGAALAEAGLALLAQGAALALYADLTAREHDLPPPLTRALAGLLTLLGMDGAATDGQVALFSMRKVHRLAATWEWLADPVSLAFLAGGWALLAQRGDRRRWRFVCLWLAWLPLRAALLAALFLHRALLTDYEAPLRLMPLFWSPWVLLLLLAGPVFLAWRLLPAAEPRAPATAGAGWSAAAALALAAALAAAGLFWDPVGRRQAGRVLMDEYHSAWEPTDRPFDTAWYGHDAGYNYACIYDYLTRFYDLRRLTQRIDDAALAAADVLILKVPTAPYDVEEVDAVVRFVERGGGVLLIGEHTDVYKTSTHLNQVARQFGFEFRKDCLFDIDDTFQQAYRPRLAPHPAVRHVPELDFAVSCSLAPGGSPGRAVIRSTGLWNLPADYHASNFYPQVEDRAEARYGAFVQLWAARRGAGRVLAFTDSTIFSNFSAFEPGKSELLLGMVEWLNHRDRIGDPRLWLLAAAAAAAAAAWRLARRAAAPALLAAAGLCGFCAAAAALKQAADMPLPEPVRPLTRVVIDRTVCDAPLSKCGFIKSSPEGFGIFEQWILRLGYFTARRAGDAVFDGQALVFLHPNRPVSEAFARQLRAYVEHGGKALIVDSAVNGKSHANSLLYPFEMSLDLSSDLAGTLTFPPEWGLAPLPVSQARSVRGGEPLAWVDGAAVAAAKTVGRGTLVVLGCGARFNDDHMGVTTDIEPTAELRQVFDAQFALLRWLVERR